MAGVFVLVLYLAAGMYTARILLCGKSPLIRGWIGLSLGFLLFMWLPTLAAFFVKFTLTAQWIALAALFTIASATCLYQKKNPAAYKAFDENDRPMIRALVFFALPMTLFMLYLQHTHTLREINGALHVGQSTYGDMAMHVSIIMGLRDASLPLEYNILPGAGAILGYPFLMDGMSTSMHLFGTSLRLSIIIPGTIMFGLMTTGFLLLAREMAGGRTSVAILAAVLLFFNGGLGFLYNFDLSGSDFSKIKEIFTGFYKTPPNFPDLNLRWSNIVVDMFLPQRTFLAGWVLLLPGLYFTREAFLTADRRAFGVSALFGAALPLVHTHSFLALALYSAGALGYTLFAKKHAPRKILPGAVLYVGVVLLLALPQVLAFTFRQAAGAGFIRPYFNWVNNTHSGMIDLYPWFWIKNIGLPLLAMLCALIEYKREDRMDIFGAALIFIVAESILFQPLEYDNNKLFYVWYALMLPMAASFCASIYDRIRGIRPRMFLAALFISVSVLSATLSMAREAVSDYELFSPTDVRIAEYIDRHTSREATFLAGLHHNNPVYTLAGRKVVCGPGNFLSTHGYWVDYLLREREVKAFYQDPKNHLDFIQTYAVDYILLSSRERYDLFVDEAALDSLFEVAHEEGTSKLYNARRFLDKE